MKDEQPGGSRHEALLYVLERELWPRTLADIGVSRTATFSELADVANREVPVQHVSDHLAEELLQAARCVCETNSLESKEELAQVVRFADTARKVQERCWNGRLAEKLLQVSRHVCETNSMESKEELARAVVDAELFHEWVETHDTRVRNLASSPVKEKDSLDTTFTMSGPAGNADLNLGREPTVEQVVDAMISGIETTSGEPADLLKFLDYFKSCAAYVEKRMAAKATRRLRVVPPPDPEEAP